MAFAERISGWFTRKRWSLTAGYFTCCVLLPIAGFIVIFFALGEPPDQRERAFFRVMIWLTGASILLSATSLLWTVWGRSPAFVRYYAFSWVIIYLAVFAFVGFIVLLAAGAHPPDTFSSFFGFSAAFPSSIALIAGTGIGFVPALILSLASSKKE